MKKNILSTLISLPQGRLRKPSDKAISLRWAIPVILLAAIVFGLYGLSRVSDLSSLPADGGMPVSPLIEEKYGVRVTLVGLSADNGLLDFRYQVLDPSKADQIMAEEENIPYLLPENGKGEIRVSLYMPHHEKIVAGRTYYLLFYNSGGIVKAGEYVTVVIGDLRLEHIPVQ